MFSEFAAAVMEGSTDARSVDALWSAMGVADRQWVRTECEQESVRGITASSATSSMPGTSEAAVLVLVEENSWKEGFPKWTTAPKGNVEYLWGAPTSHDNIERSKHYNYVQLSTNWGKQLRLGFTGHRNNILTRRTNQ